MGQKFSPAELALYRAVDEVLHYVWDPIGVAPAPMARDEYHAYLPGVYALVRDGADEATIARHLANIVAERMSGLPARPGHDLQAARLLKEWSDVIAAQQPQAVKGGESNISQK